MKRTRNGDRIASQPEADGFLVQLEKILKKTQERLAKLKSGGYEVRVVTIKEHDVVAHTRKTFEKVYLAKRITKRRRGVNPVAKAIAKTRAGARP